MNLNSLAKTIIDGKRIKRGEDLEFFLPVI